MVGNNEQRSFAQLQLKEKNQNPKCGFSEDGETLIVITQMGHYYESKINANGGALKITNQQDLLSTNRQMGQG